MKIHHWIAVAMIGVGGLLAFTAYWQDQSPSSQTPSASESDDASDETEVVQGSLVRLTAKKMAAAAIQIQTLQPTELIVTRTYPARFEYDQSLHVAINAPTDGILESIRVKPGDDVKSGQVIAVFRSPAIGQARNEWLRRLDDAELASNESDWKQTIRSGTLQLIERIEQRQAIEQIKAEMQDVTLGQYRGDLLMQYSQWLLADRLARSAGNIGQSGAVSGRVVQQRQASVDQAAAALSAAIESARFEVEQTARDATVRYQAAQRSVELAAQQVANLTGQMPQRSSDLNQPKTGSSFDETGDDETGDADGSDLSRLVLRSTIDGVVQERRFAPTERVTAGQPMFVIADTSRLWVRADIRDDDVASIHVSPGDLVRLIPTSVPERALDATVHFMGRRLDPQTGTIPLVLTVPNDNEWFRPGQFARVSVPIQRIESALVVPESAVIDVDGSTSVFVRDGESFRAVGVQLGRTGRQGVQITEGLHAGDPVVTEGAFVLKSELLLEGEE
ncbi:efflux RND transporter periplasmic adaptor subunit [Crateriforma spongiae]|uniref:efflux RND transporter periplasmic adaptor subunit n=1 Tax=Crateriforma spongiae TaxID=2724528 RepID=UPI00144891DF|nr:efflux RND transporter periplasmic adaptor subunit [Crateriforma spongiae]